MKRRAFTLVELLVVIGLIAVLISLLLPTLSKARKQAVQLQCASILRQWGQAFHIYAAQNRGIIPHTGDWSRNVVGYLDRSFSPYPQNDCGYTFVLPPLMGRKSWADFPAYQKPTGDIWQCPAVTDPPDPGSVGYDVARLGYRSFAANQYLDYDGLIVPAGYTRYPSFCNLAKAHQPSVTLLMFETTLVNAQTYNQGPPTTVSCMAGCYSDENARAFCDRHPHQPGKLGGNVMTLDGHVEWRDHLWNGQLVNPVMPPMTDREWWPY